MTNTILTASGGVKQVICINWGTRYGAPFINRLYAMVARNITPPFTFTCFTDRRDGLHPGILCEDLPPLGIAELPTNTLGIWGKSRLWGPELGRLKGPVLFLDLDLVIVSSIDGFFEVGKAEDVVLARNQNTPFRRLGQTSVFRFPVGRLVDLQRRFQANPQGIADTYRFEQRFVTMNAPGGPAFFPRRSVLHFRQDCRRIFPLNFFLPPKLPVSARIVIFPRTPLPQDAIAGRFAAHIPHMTPLEHISGVFQSRRRFKKAPLQYLRHYLLPAPWVAKHWRE
jgi:hypothetical protein